MFNRYRETLGFSRHQPRRNIKGGKWNRPRHTSGLQGCSPNLYATNASKLKRSFFNYMRIVEDYCVCCYSAYILSSVPSHDQLAAAFSAFRTSRCVFREPHRTLLIMVVTECERTLNPSGRKLNNSPIGLGVR